MVAILEIKERIKNIESRLIELRSEYHVLDSKDGKTSNDYRKLDSIKSMIDAGENILRVLK